MAPRQRPEAMARVQAARVSDDTGFFNLKATGQPGHLVEFNATKKMFSNPDNEATEAYISGRFG